MLAIKIIAVVYARNSIKAAKALIILRKSGKLADE
jgi:hypothetical protein